MTFNSNSSLPVQDMMSSSTRRATDFLSTPQTSAANSHTGTDTHILGLPAYIFNPDKAARMTASFFSISIPVNYGGLNLPNPPLQTIVKLQDMHLQDPLGWTRNFRRIVRLNSWGDETALLLMEDLIDTNILKKLEGRRTTDTKLDQLINIAFPPSDFDTYRKAMARVNRKNFGSFEAFIEKIEDLQYRANLCGRSHSQETPNDAVPMRDVLEAVVKTLTTKEKDYLSGKSGRDLTALKEGIKAFQEDQRFFNYTTYATPKTHLRLGNETVTSTTKPTSYCRYHKTTNHVSTECNYLARQKL